MNMSYLNFILVVGIEKPRPFGICNEPEQVKVGTQNHQNLTKNDQILDFSKIWPRLSYRALKELSRHVS